ncbi:hypothetical protein OG883_42050 [Streptomyces sp. NBC_01142]|uniref:hypothetical protein n=1 Tax=Streptomyces sp. NBC_01142 TaxID=2975865 RepID=UPI0022502670|nr:hypothetical protein [Streptomyces sp. NBC_01142]MCX4826243.1 hypothetical protein [Streptomyces sp. NBC_01142]
MDEEAVDVCLRLRLVPGPYESAKSALLSLDDMALLDVVDTILGWEDTEGMGGDFEGRLARLLDHAGSVYRVNDTGDGLEERITPTIRDAVRHTVAEADARPTAGSAAEHLAIAWQAAYGLHPDPGKAYGEAIKAVESAAHAVIQPNHARATLGTMLGEIGNARAKFTTAISTSAGKDPIAPVEAMMRALWDGQTSRHGKQTGTVPETLDAARASVHLAAALVQWFASGAVARTP